MAGKSTNKSGVSAQALSLPKGGGAIHGMGEKFQPDLHTGTGNFSIPLNLQPARNNLQPRQALSYTTGGGNGAFGLGWSVGVPCVSRQYSKGVPVFNDDLDAFIVSGTEDLVEVDRVEDGTRLTTYYMPRTEGLFAKIGHVVDIDQDYWDVTTKDGIRSIYGDSDTSRIFISENNTDHIFAWYLARTEDRLGNKILYHYKRDEGPTPPEPNHTYNQIYLERIEYCNYSDPDTNTEKYLFQVDFDYGEFDTSEQKSQEWKLRPDPFSSYRAGFEIRTARRCERILIRSLDPNANAPTHLIRSYDLNYVQDPLTEVSLLQGVVQRGYSTDKPGAHSGDWDFELQTDIPAHQHRSTNLYVVAFPPVSFSYTSFAPERRTIQTLSFGCDHPPEHALADPDYELIDMCGNGLPDILHTTDTGYFCWMNLGRGRFSGPRRLQSAPAGVTLRDEGVQFADMQGNGSADLLVTEGSARGFYENDFSGGWGKFNPYTQAPSFSLKDPNVRLVDLDGDGVVDVLATFEHHFLYIRNCSRDGRLEFAEPVAIPRQHDLDAWPDVYFANPENRVRLADMSGDGLQDIVLIHQGRIDYWPNLGYGRWGKRVTLLNGPHLPWGYDPRRLFLADVNGDGLADLIYVDSCSVRYWINQSGSRWSDEQVIACAPPVTNFDSVRIADVNGTGTGGILWSFDWSPMRHGNYLYLDFTGGEKPMLLNRIDNHIGALTCVEYRPSTHFYVADQDAGTPWKTSLPFPVNVVSKVTLEDAITGNTLTSINSYHHGFYEGREGEYRGFDRVDQQDTEAVDGGQHEMPPVLSKTWFHTGAYFEGEQISRQYMEEYYLESDPLEVSGGSPDEKFLAMLLEDTVLPADLSAEEAREACRALNGSILRQEIYALDKTERESRPYSISERNHTIKLLRSRGDNTHAILFAHPRETINFHYERSLYKVSGDSLVDPATPPLSATDAADPRITHSMNLSVDDFGNVLRSVSIAYGRRFKDPSLSQEDQEKQRRTLITYSENRYTNAILDPGTYHAPLPCESRTFEVVKVEPPAGPQDITNLFRFDELSALVGTQAFQDGTWDIPYHDTNHAQAVDNHPYRRLIEHDRILYRKDDLKASLQLGLLEPLALPFESYRLAFTPELASQTYVDSGKLSLTELETVLTDEGGYVKDDNGWWIPSGRVFYSPNKSDAAVKELDYARDHYFQPHRFRDPFGNTTTVSYDSYNLLVQETRDPLDNMVTAGERDEDGNLVLQGNDYRVLQPRLLMDPNRNRSAVDFDALGMVCATAVMGKPEEHLGDSLDGFDSQLFDNAVGGCWQDPFGNPHGLLQGATTRLVYDLFAYWRTRLDQQPQPAQVYTLVRETHEADLLNGQKTEIHHSFSYSDGLGRAIKKKIQAEPEKINGVPGPPRWVGSGWTIFNNKGKPIRQYEPFFSSIHHFEFARTEGVSSVLFYDPVGRVVATLHPNHTYEKVVFDPWLQSTSDVNDTVLQADPRNDPDVGFFFSRLPEVDYLPTWHALRTDPAHGAEAAQRWPAPDTLAAEKSAGQKAAAHADTPTVTHFDSLGRPFLTITHNRYDRENPSGTIETVNEEYPTRIVFDLEGNQREVIDAKGRVVMRYDYNIAGPEEGKEDAAGHRIHQDSMDAGERWMLHDVMGNPIRVWDCRKHEFSYKYDELRRPWEKWVKGGDGDTQLANMYEKIDYGEGKSPGGSTDTALNLRGKPFEHYDTAGKIRFEKYDFKGNLLKTNRRLAKEYKKVVNWDTAAPEPLVENYHYYTEAEYDALNRVTTSKTPDESVTTPTYNDANLLEKVDVVLQDGTEIHFVTNIDYNAKGQRHEITHGNGIRTVYEYDKDTSRLTHLQIKKANNKLLQDLYYTYDPAGNITRIEDKARPTIFFNNFEIEPVNEFTYDAIYRLIEANGREHAAQMDLGKEDNWDDKPFMKQYSVNDLMQWRNYTQTCAYDAVGNIEQMKHVANGGSWTRDYEYEVLNNRLKTTTVGKDPITHSYAYTHHPAHGFMTKMPHLPLMKWNFSEELQATSRQKVNSGSPETTYYVYDFDGQRVRKITDSAASENYEPTPKEERIYLGGVEIYKKYFGNHPGLERKTLHVMDDKSRIAMVETRNTVDDGSPQRLVRYQFSNHLGTACLETDHSANPKVISYEEYHPHGTTSYQAVDKDLKAAAKRYRYAGKERDEESGLYYYPARYYLPWLARWTSCDPVGDTTHLNPYEFVKNNPVAFVDDDGAKEGTPWWKYAFGIPVAAIGLIFGGLTGGIGTANAPKRGEKEIPALTTSQRALNIVPLFFGAGAAGLTTQALTKAGVRPLLNQLATWAVFGGVAAASGVGIEDLQSGQFSGLESYTDAFKGGVTFSVLTFGTIKTLGGTFDVLTFGLLKSSRFFGVPGSAKLSGGAPEELFRRMSFEEAKATLSEGLQLSQNYPVTWVSTNKLYAYNYPAITGKGNYDVVIRFTLKPGTISRLKEAISPKNIRIERGAENLGISPGMLALEDVVGTEVYSLQPTMLNVMRGSNNAFGQQVKPSGYRYSAPAGQSGAPPEHWKYGAQSQ